MDAKHQIKCATAESSSALIESRHATEDSDWISRRAVYHFVEGQYNCSEAVAAAFAESKGQNPDEWAGLFSPFGGGIAGLGKTCGALTACMMIIGKEVAEKGNGKKEIRERSRELYDRFIESFSTDSCEKLSTHDCDDSDSAPFDIRHCGQFLEKSVRETRKILRELP